MAEFAAAEGIPRWPAYFVFGRRRYPLCDGGLRHFVRVYLESGGRPPDQLTPEERHCRSLAVLGDWGSRFQAERAVRAEYVSSGGDRYAIVSGSKRSKV